MPLDWILALAGGVLIGLAALMLLAFNGRIAGISGIAGGVLRSGARDELAWRAAFLVGMIGVGALVAQLMPQAFPTAEGLAELRSLPLLLVAGVLVGFGTRMGSGCTSGHGVCGMSRLSPRSIVATLTFMAAGIVTVTLVRILGGGAA